jgi:hypothetical protein
MAIATSDASFNVLIAVTAGLLGKPQVRDEADEILMSFTTGHPILRTIIKEPSITDHFPGSFLVAPSERIT